MALKDAPGRKLAAAIIGAGLALSGAASACPAKSAEPSTAVSPRSAYYLNYHAYVWAGDYSTPVLHYYPRCGAAPCNEAHAQGTAQHSLHVAELLNLGRLNHGGQACSSCPAADAKGHAAP